MPHPQEPTELARRDVLRWGLVGASVVILGSGPSGHAGEMHMPGVERKVLKEVESNIPGYANIRIRDVIFQPGASTPMMTMENDMVCETTEGNLEGTKDGQPFTAPKGTVWTCRKGGTEMTTNKGSTVAIMHVIDLLPAYG
jgi:quercetin dioxygenase-like cupin family protein